MTGLRGAHAYYLSATAARLADDMVAVTAVLLVLDRTGSAPLAGVTVSAYTLPALVSGPLLGAWLDRTPYRRAALASGQLLVAASVLGLAVVAGHAPGWTCPLVASACGAALPLTSGGFTSMLPSLVPAATLPEANAVDAITHNTAAILGPAAAGALAAGIDPGTAAWVTATIAVASALTLAAVPAAPHRTAAAAPGLLAAVRTGLRHLAATRPLRAATSATTVGFGGLGLLVVAFPLRAEQLGESRNAGGYLWAAIEVGSIGGTLLATRYLRRRRPERTVLLALGLYGAVMACWPLAGTFAVALALAVVAGLAGGPLLSALFATRQRYTPPGLLGQISTTGASLKLAAFSLGSAMGGRVVPAFGPEPVLVVVALAQLAGAATGWFIGRPVGRHRRSVLTHRTPAPSWYGTRS
ncbi:MAG TPA: MFS transporter [Mycobacteriales bacterium]|nr:MFS transporter [Mycobacteriales bacterium]